MVDINSFFVVQEEDASDDALSDVERGPGRGSPCFDECCDKMLLPSVVYCVVCCCCCCSSVQVVSSTDKAK